MAPSSLGKHSARIADSHVRLGCQKKQKLCRNGEDTSVTWRESEPTSDGSLLAREFA